MHVGIDFVGNPVVFEKHGEKGACYPDGGAPAEPVGLQVGAKHEEFQKIDEGIAEVRENGQHGQQKESSEIKRGAEVWPTDGDPEDDHGDKNQIVEKAAELPEAHGAEKEIGEGDDGRRGHRKEPPKTTEDRISGRLAIVKYFAQ
jgi:hypothetical protein